MNAEELYDNAIQALDELYEMFDSRLRKVEKDNGWVVGVDMMGNGTPDGDLWMKSVSQRGKIGQMHYWVSKMKKKEMQE